MRWYAHNRGYDGNSRWARQEDNDEDTEKEAEARKWMDEKGTSTMAHTICALLEIDPQNPARKTSSQFPYKTLNTAYPRRIVEREVAQILEKTDLLSPEAKKFILTSDKLGPGELAQLKDWDIKLPKRYHGGLLFGQLVPRFDNRIISRCPITWAEIYDRELAKGTEKKEAKRIAERDSKVPAKKSREFLEYRFARILANIRLDGKPLPKDLRNTLFDSARKRGRLTATEIGNVIESYQPGGETNLDSYFKLHPDAEDALTLDPAANEMRKACESSQATLYPFWPAIPEDTRQLLQTEWEKGRKVSLKQILALSKDDPTLTETIKKQFAKETQTAKGKKSFPDLQTYLAKKKAGPDGLTGRAAYSRKVLTKVVEEVKEGFDPTRSAKDDEDTHGNKKATDGVLYPTLEPNSRVNELLAERPLDHLTNNHLVRHRLLILERLVKELIKEFAEGKPEHVTQVVVEVARELKEMSGMTAKQKAAELTQRLKDFTSAVNYLEENAPHLPITGGLIRKCRIAMDMGWKCPFTEEPYCVNDLTNLEKEHIIPYSQQRTNALHALVLTWPQVNEMKKKRTGAQFVAQEQGKEVPGMERLSITTWKKYEAASKAHGDARKPSKQNFWPSKRFPHHDDAVRCHLRRKQLLVENFEEREQGFTEGALTQSSHLIKLALRGLKKQLPAAKSFVIPGIATSEIRKAWNLLGTLGDPSVCGREALRWMQAYDHRTREFEFDTARDHLTFEKAELIEKKSKGKTTTSLPSDAFSCPNDECEAPLTWPAPEVSKATCPDCHAILRREVKPKEDIRSLTHLHHAIDAATLAYIAHYFPLTQNGENITGKLWRAVANRNKSESDLKLLERTKLYNFCNKLDNNGNERTRAYLQDLPAEVKNQLVARLAESRVAQHIPSNRSGSRTKQTTWGVVAFDAKNSRYRLKNKSFINDSGKKNLNQDNSRNRSENFPNPNGKGELKQWLRSSKLIGPKPKSQSGKLKAISGALIIDSNYGLALEPEPMIVAFHAVQKSLEELQKKNGGQMPRILRNGMLIRLIGHKNRDGIWAVASIQETDHKIDLIKPWLVSMKETVKLENGKSKKRNRKGIHVWRERPYGQLHKPDEGKYLEILPQSYCGVPH
ncbi:hypothetical protein JIN78_09385 [Roseibacillus ishigakijimensis]|uniref:HNH nuclease domain-containing protein n=1 Tax=Roseibacillus ishigakijimensis TaxID=454146 RepID=A0A934VMN3_9BACT|nr:type II CRISPR RNA-guided endonuclease Cas9 [Roseibacillus ishigakijimensis]MBK1834271.1 hypothetical protein [Roseibacillus ishigakijimensis]